MSLREDMIKIKLIPRSRQWLYGGIALAIIIYLAWSIWGTRPQQPGQGFVVAKPAVSHAKVNGPVVTVPIKIVPKQAVKDKFPDAHVDDPDGEVIDTADIPPAPHGATAITTIDTKTGEAHTEVKIKEAPWFAFERNNEIGAGYGINTNGRQIATIHYRRDILRVKDVHLSGQVEAASSMDTASKPEGRATLQVNWRF